MGILSYGTDTGDVEVMLKLNAIDASSAEGLRIIALVSSVESDIRAITGRSFVATEYEDQPIDGPDYGSSILTLPDRPVSVWGSIKQVLTRDDAGDPDSVYEIPRRDYVVDAGEGTLRMISGCWPCGPQALLISCTLGYTAAQIAGVDEDDEPVAIPDEIRTLKALLASILGREWKTFDLGLHNVTSYSLGDESVSSYRTILTEWQLSQIRRLKMRVL